MSEIEHPIYAAIITITLPGKGRAASDQQSDTVRQSTTRRQSATVSVVLTPSDTITTGSHTKLLRDCTIAELQAFAETWEAGVWETYQEIKLVELAEQEEARIEVVLVDENGDAQIRLQNWQQQAVLLPGEGQPTRPEPQPMETADEPITDEMETAGAADSEDSVPPADTPAAAEPEALAEAGSEVEPAEADLEVEIIPVAETAAEEQPDVVVSESEPIHEEREAEPEKAVDVEPPMLTRPRVRVAGSWLPLGHSTWAAVDIVIDEPALRAAHAHALSSPNREVAGVLVGPRPEKQPDGRYHVHVTDTIIAKYTVMQGASVTYTPESWRYMNDQLAERYPDESAVIVGWYHTHPGFGIFLSGMDQFIHKNFFTQLWHVALVLDPQARTSGFFCWDRHKTHVNRMDFAWPAWATDW